MPELQLNTGAIEWVQGASGRELSSIEQELVTILEAGLGIGPWNIHRDWSIMRARGYGASMHITRDLSTYDRDTLTRLVFAAHDRCCRLSVEPSGPRGLRVSVWPRSRSGMFYERHPTLEQAVASWRKVVDDG